MSAQVNLRKEVLRAQSDFLCTECKTPWYIHIDTKEEYCFNPTCSIRDRTKTFPNLKRAEPLNTEMKERELRFLGNLSRWKKGKLLQFAYDVRLKEVQELWSAGRVRIPEIMHIDEFMVRLSSARTGTGTPSARDFNAVYGDFASLYATERMMEDIERGRFLVTTEGETFVLKYWLAILEMFRNYGLVNIESTEFEGTYRYLDVDSEVREKMLGSRFDFGAYFDRVFDFCMTLRYGFELYQSYERDHDYEPTGAEIAALIALALSTKRPKEIWPPNGLSHHLTNNRMSSDDARVFIEKFTGGRGQNPIVIGIDGRWHFDWWSLMFYSHYLIAKNETSSVGQTSTGATRIRDAKGKASLVFDGRIRLFFSNKGYNVAPAELNVKYGRALKREYDVVACSEEKRLIAIVEAKYRDLSPSSLTRDGLLADELEGEDGVLAWAVKQQERLDLMPQNPARFDQALKFARPFEEYTRRAFVVTKFIPLVKKYRGVDVLSYPELCRTSDL